MSNSKRIAILIFLRSRNEISGEEEQELLEWRQKSLENEQIFLELNDPEYVRHMMSDLYKGRDIVFEKLKARFSYLSNVNLSDADDPEDEARRIDFPEKDIAELGLSKAIFWESLLSKMDLTNGGTPDNGKQHDNIKPLKLKTKKPRRYIRMFLRAAIVTGIIFGISKFFSESGSNRFRAGLVSTSSFKLAMDDFHRGYLAGKANITHKHNAKGELVYIFPGKPKSPKDKTYTLETNNGNEIILQLPDGTQVWMNAESAINFTANFNQDTIYVKLEGEVYFEVAPASTKHFIVLSDFTLRTEVGLLNYQQIRLNEIQPGSRFSFTTYRNDSVISVNLISGNVKAVLDTASSELAIDINNSQHSTYASGKILVNNIADSAEILALKNGEIYLKDASIETIMATVSRWYQVAIKYPGRIPNKKLNLKVPLESKISVIIDSLKKQGIHLYEQGGTITILK